MKLGRTRYAALLLVAAASGWSMFCGPAVAQADELDMTPRSELEAIILGDQNVARTRLQALVATAVADRTKVIEQLLGAGFFRDNGTTDCAMYTYNRQTTKEGATRGVSIGLCPKGDPLVLVIDHLAPKDRSSGLLIYTPPKGARP